MNDPVVSVVIPTLNEEKYLPKTLESIKNQTFKNYELIISDGGSTDKTVEIAKKYGAKVIIKHNSNVCEARDVGLRQALGEIFVGSDADTIYPKNHLELIHNEFQKDNKVVAVTGKAMIYDGPTWAKIMWKITYFILDLTARLTGYVIYAPALNLAYKRNVFLKIGGYNTKLDFGGDELDVLARLRKVGKVIYNHDLYPQTSGRRFKVGFFIFFFKHALYYYWISYILAKIFDRTPIRAKPVR